MRALSDPQFSVFIGCTLVSVVGWLYVVLAPSAHRARALAEKVNISTALSAYAAAVCGALSQTFLKSVSVGVGHSLAQSSWRAALTAVWLQPPMWVVRCAWRVASRGAPPHQPWARVTRATYGGGSALAPRAWRRRSAGSSCAPRFSST